MHVCMHVCVYIYESIHKSTLACLHELAGVIISREARCFRAVSTRVKFHRPSAKALFDGVRLVTAGAAGFGRAAVLTGRVIHPCKITLEPPATPHSQYFL